MSHLPTYSSSLRAPLIDLDLTFVHQVQAGGCPSCGGQLNRADYFRKPRGGPDDQAGGGEFARRFALCCAREGCRKRAPVPSARFAGRRVYVAALIVLVVARRQAAPPRRETIAELVRAIPGIARRTIQRWVTHWAQSVPKSRWWKAVAGRLAVCPGGAAHRLVASFDAWDDADAIARMMACAPTPSY